MHKTLRATNVQNEREMIMKNNYLIILRVLSIIFGLSVLLGFLWFGDYYQSVSIPSILFEGSTGVSLLIFACMPNFLMRNIIVRIFLIGGLIIGAANCIYKIPGHCKIINGPDYGAIIIEIIILGIIIIILRYLIKLKQENKLLE
jgi:hypothetical protein